MSQHKLFLSQKDQLRVLGVTDMLDLISMPYDKQIETLRKAASLSKKINKYLGRINFDDDLKKYAEAFINGTIDIIHDSSIESLKTEQEIIEETRHAQEEADTKSYLRANYNDTRL